MIEPWQAREREPNGGERLAAPPFVERRTHVEEARFGEVAAASNGEERDEAVVIRIAVHRDDAFALLALREQNGAHSEHETLRLKDS